MKLLLASQSPRRRQLLATLGYPVEYISADVAENTPPTLPAEQKAEYLARLKADACPAHLIGNGDVLVAADTVVVLHGNALGKPRNRQEALDMLHALAGNSHSVFTGVCLRTQSLLHSFSEQTTVHFAPLTDETIAHYVDTYRPFDKAGAYGIQEWIGMVGITRIEGCYYNVMGLPVARLYHELQQLA